MYVCHEGLAPCWQARTPLPPDMQTLMPKYTFTLNAGDACFVPRGWWHKVFASPSVESGTSASVALNWYYGTWLGGCKDDNWPES
jgi:hypothetical protein